MCLGSFLCEVLKVSSNSSLPTNFGTQNVERFVKIEAQFWFVDLFCHMLIALTLHSEVLTMVMVVVVLIN